MNNWRYFIAVLLSLALSYSTNAITYIYNRKFTPNFGFLGTISNYEVSCDELPIKFRENCASAYSIPLLQNTILTSIMSHTTAEVGIGFILRDTLWLCYNAEQHQPIYESSSSTLGPIRHDLLLYNTATVPIKDCSNRLYIKLKHDDRFFFSRISGTSGPLTIGHPAIIRSYKNAIDFFSSYFRILLAGLCFLLLLVSNDTHRKKIPGLRPYRWAIFFVAVHFFASSSLIDVILPTTFSIGFLLLMAGGSASFIALIISALQVYSSKASSLTTTEPVAISTIRSFVNSKFVHYLNGPSILLFLTSYYAIATGSHYLPIQTALMISSVIVALLTRSAGLLIFSALAITNILAAYNVLPGHPTNSASHFLLFLFVIDTFESLKTKQRLIYIVNESKTHQAPHLLLSFLVERFKIKRISTSMFTNSYEFITRRFTGGSEQTLTVEKRVSRLAAHVMTSRIPLLRVQVASEESKILKGPDAKFFIKRGHEFCIFPLIYSEKALGTLNISGYPRWLLAEPMQMNLFYSLIIQLTEPLAELKYRSDLSPNIDEQHKIQTLQAKFLAQPNRSHENLVVAFGDIAKSIDATIIISKAEPDNDRFRTFSSHNYTQDAADFLETHTPSLSNRLVASPANIAFHQKSAVFIGNILSMLSIYQEFLVGLLKQNETKSLFVSPILIKESDSPWGLVWLEFHNRFHRPESDLRELGEFVTKSFTTMLCAHFDYREQQLINEEFSSAVPEYVVAKIKQNIDPREVEEGYLLNIDLSGSTKLANAIGNKDFTKIIENLTQRLEHRLSLFDFRLQMIVWDSFAFTRKQDRLNYLDTVVIDAILHAIADEIEQLNATELHDYPISFRAILNHGDTTRDWSNGNLKHWTIVGSAYAESCKLEQMLKPETQVILIDKSCPNFSSTTKRLLIDRAA